MNRSITLVLATIAASGALSLGAAAYAETPAPGPGQLSLGVDPDPEGPKLGIPTPDPDPEPDPKPQVDVNDQLADAPGCTHGCGPDKPGQEPQDEPDQGCFEGCDLPDEPAQDDADQAEQTEPTQEPADDRTTPALPHQDRDTSTQADAVLDTTQNQPSAVDLVDEPSTDATDGSGYGLGWYLGLGLISLAVAALVAVGVRHLYREAREA